MAGLVEVPVLWCDWVVVVAAVTGLVTRSLPQGLPQPLLAAAPDTDIIIIIIDIVTLSSLLHLLDTALLPGVVPYPELLGREATDHRLPSPDLASQITLSIFPQSEHTCIWLPEWAPPPRRRLTRGSPRPTPWGSPGERRPGTGTWPGWGRSARSCSSCDQFNQR